MAPSLDDIRFYAILFCMLNGENKIKWENKVEINVFLFSVIGHHGWDKPKRKVSYLL